MFAKVITARFFKMTQAKVHIEHECVPRAQRRGILRDAGARAYVEVNSPTEQFKEHTGSPK